MWILDLSWSSSALRAEESDPPTAEASNPPSPASALIPVARLRAKRRIRDRSVSFEGAMEEEEEEVVEIIERGRERVVWGEIFSSLLCSSPWSPSAVSTWRF